MGVVGLVILGAMALVAVPFLNPEVHTAPAGYQGLRFLSQSAQAGYSPYKSACASCHGFGGEGTDKGPPLRSAGIAGDFRQRPAFHRAVDRGVAAHQALLGNTANFNQIELMGKFLREARRREIRNGG